MDGAAVTAVNALLKQFTEMQKLMKQFAGGGRKGALGKAPKPIQDLRVVPVEPGQ